MGVDIFWKHTIAGTCFNINMTWKQANMYARIAFSIQTTPPLTGYMQLTSAILVTIGCHSPFDALQTYDGQQNDNISKWQCKSFCFFLKVAMNILNSGRFGIGAGAGGGLRRLIGNVHK